jgi:hypothetical protein
MSAHVVLLVGLDPAFEAEPSIASELEGAGYEVIEARNLSAASALLFVHRRVEAVVIDATSDRIAAELAKTLSAIRPGLPLLTAAGTEAHAPADGQAGHRAAAVISTLDGLTGQRDARQRSAATDELSSNDQPTRASTQQEWQLCT